MARTSGPLFAESASGTLANQLTYATWKGRSYVKKKGVPTGELTTDQSIFQQIMRFLTKQWSASLTQADRDTWLQQAIDTNTSPINAFTAENIPPTPSAFQPHKQQGQAAGGTPPVPIAGSKSLVVSNKIRVHLRYTTLNDVWGNTILFNVQPGAATPPIMRSIQPTILDNANHNYDFPATVPGTYDVTVYNFTTRGLLTFEDFTVGLVIH
jgi:hypothetical protein